MEEKKKKILEFFNDENYVPMKMKEIAYVLGLDKEKFNELGSILDELENEYKIQKNKKGKYMLVDNSMYVKGTFKKNIKGFGFVSIEDSDEEIFISKNNIYNAIDEDIVLVEVFKEEINVHKEGKIIKVLKHGKDSFVGTFQKSRNFGFVVLDDKKIGTDIFISKRNSNNARNNDKVVVKITKNAVKGRKIEGKIIEVLGHRDEAGMDMLSLVKEYKLPYEFPSSVLAEAKEIRNKLVCKELKNRIDYREKLVFTIDGEGAKDLDDAIHIEKKENGNYILGVHIADVSHYVKENSECDKEAIIRGTSVYMMDRVIPMLPKELSNGICSLNEGEDRLALSVIMEINSKGKVIDADIQKTVINVTKRMSYNKVYKILKNLYIEKYKDNEELNNVINISGEDINVTNDEKQEIEIYKEYFNCFEDMMNLALILKKKRVKDGSLDLNIPESKIVLNDIGIAVDIKKYENTFSNEIIEQFMLIANETVAEKFYWLEAPFIYRVHSVPDIEKIAELNKFLWNLGYKIKCSKDNIYTKSFSDVLEKVKGKPEERIVSNLILRTLKIAQYESENKGHFGLASKYYCHFTSPIRRYPDLFIHRIISKYLEKNYNIKNTDSEKYKIQSEKYAKTSSEREKVAQKVERDSVDIKKAEYMQSKIGQEYEGIISNITSFGVFVELENTVEGLIRFENLGNEFFVFNEENKTLIGEKSGNIYKIGDSLNIRVIEANKELRRISFEKV
ncbi:MAG: RNB domain-containing ribonuclease [Clostridiales bacterium]|nr:RNB domain-containing ribonuclease [Clostridiales bacterium]